MDKLKAYYKAQANTQPEPSLIVKPNTTAAKAKHRPTSIAAIIAAMLVLSAGVATLTGYITNSTDIGSGGEALISVDMGATWQPMDEFMKDNPMVEIEWFTYEELSAEAEQMKEDLKQSYIAIDNQWVLITEAFDSFRRYDIILEHVRDGRLKISKTVDGLDGYTGVSIIMGYGDPQNILSYELRELSAGGFPGYGFTIKVVGDMISFGPYNTREELEAAVREYMDENPLADDALFEFALAKYE